VKFLSVDGFLFFFKLKICVALSNHIRSVWALTLTLCQSLTQILAFVTSQTKQLDRAQISTVCGSNSSLLSSAMRTVPGSMKKRRYISRINLNSFPHRPLHDLGKQVRATNLLTSMPAFARFDM
jgi:hypothetical protein